MAPPPNNSSALRSYLGGMLSPEAYLLWLHIETVFRHLARYNQHYEYCSGPPGIPCYHARSGCPPPSPVLPNETAWDYAWRNVIADAIFQRSVNGFGPYTPEYPLGRTGRFIAHYYNCSPNNYATCPHNNGPSIPPMAYYYETLGAYLQRAQAQEEMLGYSALFPEVYRDPGTNWLLPGHGQPANGVGQVVGVAPLPQWVLNPPPQPMEPGTAEPAVPVGACVLNVASGSLPPVNRASSPRSFRRRPRPPRPLRPKSK
jgi:hypothetical protein